MPPLLGALHLAAVFLTRLPLPRLPQAPPPLAQAMAAFPVVGAGLGLLGWTVLAAAEGSGLPAEAAAILAVGALLLATGALHEDGLADVADGCGGATRARRLEILRDSRIGAYGVLALIVVLLLRVVALAEMPRLEDAGRALVVGGALGRAALPLAMRLCPPARADGLGAAAGVPGAATVIVALLVAGGVAAVAAPEHAVAAVVALLAVTLALTLFAWRRLGGYTGDVLGAVAVAVETAVLLVFLAG
jgi:adenosylcobinamide-GDP ribazoletransferase